MKERKDKDERDNNQDKDTKRNKKIFSIGEWTCLSCKMLLPHHLHGECRYRYIKLFDDTLTAPIFLQGLRTGGGTHTHRKKQSGNRMPGR